MVLSMGALRQGKLSSMSCMWVCQSSSLFSKLTQHHAAPRSTTQHHATPRSTTRHHATPRSPMHYHAASRNIPSTITINIPHLFSPSTIDVQQVVDFSIAYDEKNNAVYGLLYIFQGGTTYVTSLILLASFIIH